MNFPVRNTRAAAQQFFSPWDGFVETSNEFDSKDKNYFHFEGSMYFCQVDWWIVKFISSISQSFCVYTSFPTCEVPNTNIWCLVFLSAKQNKVAGQRRGHGGHYRMIKTWLQE